MIFFALWRKKACFNVCLSVYLYQKCFWEKFKQERMRKKRIFMKNTKTISFEMRASISRSYDEFHIFCNFNRGEACFLFRVWKSDETEQRIFIMSNINKSTALKKSMKQNRRTRKSVLMHLCYWGKLECQCCTGRFKTVFYCC